MVTCDGLQGAYDIGYNILTTSAKDIAFTLAGSLGTSTSFTLENAGTAKAFVINDTNATTGQTAFEIQSGSTPTLNITEAGVVSLAGGTVADITTLSGVNGLTIKGRCASRLNFKSCLSGDGICIVNNEGFGSAGIFKSKGS